MDITPKLFTDSIELMGLYIAYMRQGEDLDTIPKMLNSFNDTIFKASDISKDQLRQLGVYAIDRTYRFTTELEVRDVYTVTYFKSVVARLMQSLQKSGIEIFYILDNELRQDRFELTTMLFELSGAAVVSPYNGNEILSFEEVEDRLKGHMTHRRNMLYIEKDSSVDYLGKVIRIATESRYIGIFRNHEPSVDYLKIL
jgi:hypothetical protein